MKKPNKTILVASGSMLAAGMAHGAIVYNYVNQDITSINNNSGQSNSGGGDGFYIDLNGDGTNDFNVYFDSNYTKPAVRGLSTAAVPAPWVFNEVNMDPNNNGMPVIPDGTEITNQFTVGTNTVSPGVDSEGNHRGYLYQSTTGVGQWPSTQETVGYVGLAMVDTGNTSTNFGWVRLDWNPTNTPNGKLTVIDYAYETTPNLGITTGVIPTNGPVIVMPPTNQTVVAGSTIAMSVVGSSYPSPAYQWMAGAVGSGNYTNLPNAGEFSGVNTAILTISNVTPADQRDYVVVLTNIISSITSSPPATLTVLPAGILGPVPNQQVIYAGYPAQFAVTDLGGGFTNSWLRNGAIVNNGGVYSGATSGNLLISSVEPGNVGNYVAIESTAYGSATSSVAPLSIAYPDGSLYESAVRAYGAMSYYRLNETSGTNAWDFIGGKTGIYKSPNVSFGNNGPTSAAGFPGFISTNYAADFQADGSIDTNAYVTCLPWNFNTNTVTLTAWIYPTFREGADGLNSGIVCAVTNSSMICGIRYDGTYPNTNGISDANIGYNWNNDGLGAGAWNSQITAPHNEWSLIALTISPTNAVLYIINNSLGVQASEDVRSHSPVRFNTTEYIGTYPLEQPLGVNNFAGYIDEVAIFNSTLSSNQVYALYQSALGQSVVPPGLTITSAGANSQVRWTSGVLLQAPDLLGPWTTNMSATSPYTINPTSPQQFFRAKQ